MTVISQGLTLPGNVVTGGTIQSADVATLYAAMNAFTIPGTIGVWQQGFVDNNKYSVPSGSVLDWAFASTPQKAMMFQIPFSWTGSTSAQPINIRYNTTAVTTSTAFQTTNAASGEGMIMGFMGSRSTDQTKVLMAVLMDNGAPTTWRPVFSTINLSTQDASSLGIAFSTAAASGTAVINGVRIWVEG